MASTALKKRPSIRSKSKAKSTESIPNTSTSNLSTIDTGFSNTKKDKRIIKHSAFVNRIQKTGKKTAKRRRPSKKLVTTLESLGDNLPEIVEKPSKAGKIKQTSVKTRPGAMKRKQKAERIQMERFGKNMAQLMAGVDRNHNASIAVNGTATVNVDCGNDGHVDPAALKAISNDGHAATPDTAPTASRWAALRSFIEQTMEQKEEFEKKAG